MYLIFPWILVSEGKHVFPKEVFDSFLHRDASNTRSFVLPGHIALVVCGCQKTRLFHSRLQSSSPRKVNISEDFCKSFPFSSHFKSCFNLNSSTFSFPFPSQSLAASSAMQPALRSAMPWHAMPCRAVPPRCNLPPSCLMAGSSAWGALVVVSP